MPDLQKSTRRRVKDKLSGLFSSNPMSSPRPASGSLQAKTTQVPSSTTLNHPLSTSAPIYTSQTSTTQTPPVATTPTASSVPLGTPNPYLATGGLPVSSSMLTGGQRMKEVGSTVYAGLTQVVQGLYDCSDMFLPLKTAAGVFLTVSKVVDRMSTNRTELEELAAKLKAILSIVRKYKEHDGMPVLKQRIETFCEAIVLQMKAVEDLHDHSVWARTAESTTDADKIAKAFRTMSILCNVFQMDTALDTGITVTDILQRLRSGAIEKLSHESTSYKTRHSSYGNPSGCMEGTRVKALADLESWASDDDGCKVYWMVGMAGTGKSTISQTFCEILYGRNMLAASFFCSRASEKTNNARFIVPTIAHELAKTSPSIKAKIVMAIDDDEKLAEANYLNLKDQFDKLIYQPIRASIGMIVKTYKIIVIDAVDECSDPRLVSDLIRLILDFVTGIPLKIFIASRDESLIRKAFKSGIHRDFYLHDVEKDVVKDDIHKYLETSLAKIRKDNGDDISEDWPSKSELDALLDRSGTLFIYAATAVRYIADGNELYRDRLSDMANRGLELGSGFQTDIDGLYGHVLEKACDRKPPREVSIVRELVSDIVFLRKPLSAKAIASILQMDPSLLSAYLSPLTSVIHVPIDKESTIAPFHASFPDFLTDSTRCSPERCPRFRALFAPEGHTTLALRCLEHMNRSLKYNICDVPKELTVSRRGLTNSPENIEKISEALQYSCLHWTSHLAEVRVWNTDLITALHVFLHEHLLHWIECVSALGELRTGLTSLGSATTTVSRFITADIRWNSIQSLVQDAYRCVQMNFEGIQKNCLEIYQSVLVWIPKKSSIRKVYAEDIHPAPKVVLGLSDWWGPTELVIQNSSPVRSVAFSPDGRQVVSGSNDKTVRIWDTTTGEIEAELKGHINEVLSVAFSPDGCRVVSGSFDQTILIWNATTGEVESKLEGHTDQVTSVAFSSDGGRVVSGSEDATVRIWNAMTGEAKAELEGHTDRVLSVAFSPDNSRIVSGSFDQTVRIWNATTGEAEAKLEGHTDIVRSVAFSPDGSRIVSGSKDDTVRIWNSTTGKEEAELKGHKNTVASAVFSPDGNLVVSGSYDWKVRIWNATTGEVKAELKGHTSVVFSVVFSPNSSQLVSGSHDGTLRIWNAMASEGEAKSKSHKDTVRSIAFSPDGNRIVSGSDDETVQIWNATTGEAEAELKGHTDTVESVAFSPDGSRVVSGSDDRTVRIWSAKTGEIEAELKGHTLAVTSVAFSTDSSRVVSGSADQTVRIWNATTGEVEVELKHTDTVCSVAFSPDGSRVVSGSYNGSFRIWNTATSEIEAELKGHTDWVMSVAFSLNGSRVVSGSYDNTILIWNVMNHESQLMTTPFVTLPDFTEVHYEGPGNFHIIYPTQQPKPTRYPTPHLSDDSQWIVGPFHDCWIPPHDRNFLWSSFSGSRVCLGYGSGRVVILDMIAPQFL